MSDKQPPSFYNRELSWLAFNQRVLEEALDPNLPLLERLKFLAITASNLDEFFMIRVGGLWVLEQAGSEKRDAAGLTPREQLAEIRKGVRAMIEQQYALLTRELEPALEREGIRRVRRENLTSPQRRNLRGFFSENLYPALTPMAVEPSETQLTLPALTLILACRLEPEPGGEEEPRYAVVPLPPNLPRFVPLSEGEGYTYALLGDAIRENVDQIFLGEKVTGSCLFRITRNGDITVQEDEAYDLADEMREVLLARKTSDTIRLEISNDAPPEMIGFLQKIAVAGEAETFILPHPLDLSAFMQLATSPGFDELKYEPWDPQATPAVESGETMFETLQRRDILLFHPYESFDPVVRLIEEAADDPDVLSIKQLLYRTSKRSRIIAALCRAAEMGKNVTALIELKARFDEARNLEQSEALERAGVQLIYGVKGLKSHAKICLVVRREAEGIRRYCHFGTGNYNESTAKLYTDLSYMTCREEYGSDASIFFNAVSGYSQLLPFQRLAAAPLGMRSTLLDRIKAETERARQGDQGEIMAKMNSLEDREIIKALYAAGQAGVKILLNIRGICCLKAGVKGLSENIRVVSIVDRYLEHARVFAFSRGGEPEVWISSADWMRRNLSRRVELMTPIEDPDCQNRLVGILKTYFKDNVKAWELQTDGTFQRPKPGDGKKPVRVQEVFHEEACRAAHDGQSGFSVSFTPHVPQGGDRR